MYNLTSLSNVSECVPVEVQYPDTIDLLSLKILFGFMVALLCLLGLLGNIAVIYNLSCTKVAFHIRHVFIWNLTLSNLLLTCVTLPITGFSTLMRTWIFGTFLCRVFPVVQCVTVFVTSFTLIWIAYDRKKAVSGVALQAGLSQTTIILVLILSWLCAALISSPYGANMRLIQFSVPVPNGTLTSNDTQFICGWFCEEDWPSVTYKQVFGVTVLICQYILPLILITVNYMSVIRSVQNQTIIRLLAQTTSLQSRVRLLRRRRKVNKMVTAMLLSFFLVWLPLHVMNFLRDFNLAIWIFSDEVFALVFLCSHLIAMSTVVWNPIIYTFWNAEFAEALAQKITFVARILLTNPVSKVSAAAATYVVERRSSSARHEQGQLTPSRAESNASNDEYAQELTEQIKKLKSTSFNNFIKSSSETFDN